MGQLVVGGYLAEEAQRVAQGPGQRRQREEDVEDGGAPVASPETIKAASKTPSARRSASRTGHRFQERYRCQQACERGWRDPRRLFFVVGGLVVAIGSLAFGVLPGPGTLTFFLGLAMIAGEFRPVARLLDRAEVGARKLGRRVGGTWRSSAAGKALVVSVGAICAAAVLYVAYLLLFAG